MRSLPRPWALRSPRARSTAAVLAVAAACLQAPGPVRAEETHLHPVFHGFLPTGRYSVYVNREHVPHAQLLHSTRAAAYLVLDTPFGRPFLIVSRSFTVHALPLEQVLFAPNGQVDLPASVQLTDLGRFSLAGTDVVIGTPALQARLVPKPPILGLHTAAEVRTHTPEYEREDPGFVPDAGAVAALRRAPEGSHLVVYFGTWCPTCQRLLPRILRVERALEGSPVRISFYGLPRAPEMFRDPEVRQRDIRRLPTGDVWVGNRSAGRILDTGWNRPEHTLRSLLLAGR